MIGELTVEVKGLRVSYLANSSQVNAPKTIVFIHGFPFSKEMWREQLNSLPSGFRGLAYDIRGFGNSSGGHSFFSIDLFAKDLIAFIEALNIQRPVICGLSMGGYIALRAIQLDPEKFSGLVLADTNALADSEEAKLKRFETIELVQAGGKERFAESFLANVFAERSFEDQAEAVRFIRDMILSTSESTICSAQLALASRTSTLEYLKEIRCPALIIKGEFDKLMSDDHLADLEAIPDSYSEIIPDAAHLSNIEGAPYFNFYLSQFLQKHFPS